MKTNQAYIAFTNIFSKQIKTVFYLLNQPDYQTYIYISVIAYNCTFKILDRFLLVI